MATNFAAEGNVLNWYNAGSAVTSGSVVQVGYRSLGVALTAIGATATGSVMIDSVFSFAKDTADAAEVGAPAFWDGTKLYNDVGRGRWFIGHFAERGLAAATTAKVKLGRFADEGVRFLTLAATGNQALAAADFMTGRLDIEAPNTAAYTVTLPSVATIPVGSLLRVKKTNAAAHAVTLDGAGDETIAGNATFATIDANNDWAVFQSTGAAWVLVDSAIA
jgi:predicted RecA/RadA family phage recombinase